MLENRFKQLKQRIKTNKTFLVNSKCIFAILFHKFCFMLNVHSNSLALKLTKIKLLGLQSELLVPYTALRPTLKQSTAVEHLFSN